MVKIHTSYSNIKGISLLQDAFDAAGWKTDILMVDDDTVYLRAKRDSNDRTEYQEDSESAMYAYLRYGIKALRQWAIENK